jgi:hypothetical protein
MSVVKRKIKYEECVVCHCMTDTPVDTPVTLRKNFVYGVGELCDKCFLDVYSNVDNGINEAYKRLIDE